MHIYDVIHFQFKQMKPLCAIIYVKIYLLQIIVCVTEWESSVVMQKDTDSHMLRLFRFITYASAAQRTRFKNPETVVWSDKLFRQKQNTFQTKASEPT